MPYDPFASESSGAVRKLTRARWPRFYSKELRSLEWGKGETRKRPRFEGGDDENPYVKIELRDLNEDFIVHQSIVEQMQVIPYNVPSD